MSEAQQDVAVRADHKTRFSAKRQPENHGRPGTYKDKLTTAFLRGLSEDFAEYGQETIRSLRADDPASYVKIVASLVPKEFRVTRALDGVDDEKLAALLEILMAFRKPEDAKEITAELLND